MENQRRKSKYILLLILVVGSALRFYGFPNIPFTYDELSSWGRTGYSNFSDIIDQGVRGDGHPAFIQVFLNYWREIFGDSEAAFKFPFLLMGLTCIFLIYLVGKLWYNETVGLICASCIGVLQYTVMYSQVARPYISGMFFSLMMVLSWTKYIFSVTERRRFKFLIGFIVFAVLCCYNHYFSFLFAFIAGISGFFFLPRKNLIEYSLSGIVVAVLFLPHAGITLDQFKVGGVGGWLSKPDESFIWNYIDYLFHFSVWLKLSLLIVVMLGFYFIEKGWMTKNKFRIISLVWFLLPILVGYWYSRSRNPVLQFSVLIFSFPYLLLFIFSFFRNVKFWYQLVFVLLIMAAGTYSLVVERRHYEIFYKQPVEQMMRHSVEFVSQHRNDSVDIIINEPLKYMTYYLSKWDADLSHLYSWQDLNFQSYVETKKFIDSRNADYLVAGNIPYDHFALIRNYFPKLVKVDKGFTYESFILGKGNISEKEINDLSFSDSVDFRRPGVHWKADSIFVMKDSSGSNYFYHQNSSQEWGPSFTAWLRDFMRQRDDILLVNYKVRNVGKDSKAKLVISFDQNGQTVFYQDKPFSHFIDSNETAGDLVYAFRFRDFEFTHTNPLLKAYIWNEFHEEFDITSMKVEVQKGNPLIYGLIEPVPH